MAYPTRVAHPNSYFLGKSTSSRIELSTTASTAMPGYAGYRPGICKGRASAAPSERSETSSVYSDLGSTPGSPGKPISHKVWKAPPGYTGYTPGVHAGGTYAKTYAEGNKAATRDLKRAPAPEVPLPMDKFHEKQKVPGYAGYMPGKASDSLIGSSNARAAKEGWLSKERSNALGGGIVRVD
mmetsp:Transcript_15583/g.33872  ORF Transcript_15583/g.33872 Transcript_15583/m.33872 type:complete len:182 (-) Transcript_15583:531-1076(-)|eukprot:CAMPEP_0194763744 /NCGR_PEP_ID=MMETSP0323_2-20130528/20428_1 /TAXON_ID=2866 ORGANISM="Crypthecodinium cohnii, Strain Seligo" /NCGR_SAMPLE_ID=MMETSP0323_2 /ASSEMBLY_ACC=CAM_ASM_000346 /LENGTH=181 /DNA_ID=CAMNT_0039689283 /DNA_START=60 /DNA_END=605 /DNA_ORIENTATION=-